MTETSTGNCCRKTNWVRVCVLERPRCAHVPNRLSCRSWPTNCLNLPRPTSPVCTTNLCNCSVSRLDHEKLSTAVVDNLVENLLKDFENFVLHFSKVFIYPVFDETTKKIYRFFFKHLSTRFQVVFNTRKRAFFSTQTVFNRLLTNPQSTLIYNKLDCK